MIELVIRTARYHNPKVKSCGLVAVGITRSAPRFPLDYEVRANLYDLAPTYAMMKMPAGPDHRRDFTDAYRARLEALGYARACELLVAIQNGDAGLVLLCYEDLTQPDEWCHRQILAAWLTEHGLVVSELEDEGKKAKRAQGRLFA